MIIAYIKLSFINLVDQKAFLRLKKYRKFWELIWLWNVDYTQIYIKFS
ncbi:hypothetical protein CSG_16740 [Campylobacter fetus subsp. venerealis str. 84-112]|nr:hypothetical protein CSG_16740 [Campylobacter fetus subsp. venerealis str. 84-112]